MNPIRKGLVVAVIVLFIGMSVPSTGMNVKKSTASFDSNTLYVGGSGEGNYTKIQDAINDSSEGDTVFVYNGTYYENVVLNKSINLIGEDKDTTIIDGSYMLWGFLVKVTADWVNISGFSIINMTIEDYSGGIYLKSCNNSNISNNIITNNWQGMYLVSSCNHNIISNCDFAINDFPIIISDSNNNTFTDNNITRNLYAITLLDANCNIIVGNNISNNVFCGPILDDSNYNTIKMNNIMNNDFGIKIHFSYNNIIYHNNLIDNRENSYDEGNNTWDDGYPSGGNYWDDYNGTDNDGDGIGDIPYPIPGGDNEDRYPLMEPYNNDTKSFFGTTGPICPLLNIVEIEIIDGNESQIEKIEKWLNNRLFHYFIPRFIYFNVTDLDFKVSYTKKIPKPPIPFFWRFVYLTILEENGNETLIEKPHIVTVKGFNGLFGIVRGQPIRLFPPHFVFEGDFEELTIEYLTGV